jgi:hypothetical protein
MEQAIDGESWVEYVKQVARDTGGIWEPPSRIADMVNGLLALDDKFLNIVRGSIQGTIRGILEGEKMERQRPEEPPLDNVTPYSRFKKWRDYWELYHRWPDDL